MGLPTYPATEYQPELLMIAWENPKHFLLCHLSQSWATAEGSKRSKGTPHLAEKYWRMMTSLRPKSLLMFIALMSMQLTRRSSRTRPIHFRTRRFQSLGQKWDTLPRRPSGWHKGCSAPLLKTWELIRHPLSGTVWDECYENSPNWFHGLITELTRECYPTLMPHRSDCSTIPLWPERKEISENQLQDVEFTQIMAAWRFFSR